MLPKIAGFDTYSIMINLGTVVGIAVFGWSFYHRIPSKKLLLQNFLICLALLMVGTKGAQAVRMLNTPEKESFQQVLWRVWTEPLGSHFVGRVLVTVVLYVPVYCLWRRYSQKSWEQNPILRGKSIWQTGTDALSLYFVVQHIGNRFGCLGEGCCFGKPYHGPGALLFTTGTAAEMGVTYPVFPSQIFEIFLMVLLLVWMLYLYRKGKPLFAFFLSGFGFSIFLSEFFMDQQGVPLYFGLNFIQVISLVLIFMGIAVLLFRHNCCESRGKHK